MNIIVLLTTFLASAFLFQGVICGYEGFLCPKVQKTKEINLKEGGGPAFPCDKDCVQQHGARNGTCGRRSWRGQNDYNCYCSKERAQEVYPYSLHCTEDKGRFRQMCVSDCQCNHAATSGYCDFEKKACICTGQGRDVKNSLCQFKNVIDFADYLGAIIPQDSLGWPFLQQFITKPNFC